MPKSRQPSAQPAGGSEPPAQKPDMRLPAELLGAGKQGYILGVVATKRYVYAFEAWGEKNKVDAAQESLIAAFKTLDVKHS